MWVAFKRMVRAGTVGFWRNAFVSLASVFVMTIALFVIGAILIIDQLLGSSLSQIENKVDINVYFNINAADSDMQALKARLEALPEVEEVTFTSRDESLALFRERHKNDELTIQALDELGDNPLGASLAVQARDTSQYETISRFLEEQRAGEVPSQPVIDRVNFVKNKEVIEKLASIINVVERASIVTMAILVVASVMITFNTIRLAIYTSREEITVMRLVGASNTFIRGPFMLQGVLYGLIAGTVALLIMYPLLYWLGPGTETFFGFNIFHFFIAQFAYVFSVIVGSGVGLGLISSGLAVSRYLRA
ncbi:MAG: ABC transporter permease [Candidatus Pacebacteria bacterium]|nr:ABC transporter permease [Candidatus Paceibacterota bacterium]